MMTPIFLHGHLAAKFGSDPRVLDVRSPGEAIRALCVVVKDFEKTLRESSIGYSLIVRNSAIFSEELEVGFGISDEFHVVPEISGAKSDGVEFITGAALVALSIMGFPEVLSLDATGGAIGISGAAALNSFVGALGVSMAIGGIARMLTTSPQATQNSAVFSGISNTVAQGVPVPCAYGQFYVTAPLISQKIVTQTFNSVINGVNTGAGGGGGGSHAGGPIGLTC